jgi:copper resistance protein C
VSYGIRQIVASIGLVMITAPALAHATLQKATPPAGGTLSASPTEIRLQFSERVEPSFSGITLANTAGARIPTGPPSLDPDNDAVLVVKVQQTLALGTYTVTWRAVSIDTHRTQGGYRFSVGQ